MEGVRGPNGEHMLVMRSTHWIQASICHVKLAGFVPGTDCHARFEESISSSCLSKVDATRDEAE